MTGARVVVVERGEDWDDRRDIAPGDCGAGRPPAGRCPLDQRLQRAERIGRHGSAAEEADPDRGEVRAHRPSFRRIRANVGAGS